MQEIKNISEYRQLLHNKILEVAMHLFTVQGIKAVKMDDIARHLNISKRTLYEIYDNKETLLFECVKYFRQVRQQELVVTAASGRNVMDIILKVYRQKVDEFRQIAPAFYDDLEKYPRVLAYLDEDKQHMQQQMLSFLKRGVKEGYFRKDIDFVMTGRLFDAIVHYVMTNRLYQQYDIEDIFKHLLFVSLRGICTHKGVLVLDEFLK
jgi:AcrR family transcriptional regulator